MRLNEVGVKKYQSATILNEGWQQLTEAQQVYIGRWEKNVWPLVEQYNKLLEQELTPDQIQKIFTSAEQVAKATGKNQTALGKAGAVTSEVTGKMKAEIDKLLKQAADSGPVKNMNAQFDKLRSQLAGKLKGNPTGQKILQGVDKWKTYAEENPATSAFILGAMTSLLAFASGGFMSGAAIGFFLRLANNTIKGDDLSTAIGKGVKGAAIGALAGGLSQVIGELVPPDIEQMIIAGDGQTIDVNGLEAMTADSLENLEPDQVGDLLKTQNALETAVRSAEDEDTRQMALDQLGQVSDKIRELGGAEELQDFSGLTGRDLETSTTSSTETGNETGTSEVETVSSNTISSEELNNIGVNFDTEPDISPEVVEWAESKNIDPDQLQSLFQMEKAIDDAEFLGSNISANNEIQSAYTNGEPNLETTTIQGNEVIIGERYKSDISISLPGIDEPINFTSTVKIEGVDADGSPVFQIVEVQTSPDHPLWDNLDGLSDEDYSQLFDYMNAYTGRDAAEIGTFVDTFKQDLAKSIGAAATAAAVGGAMADKEVKAGATDLDKKESIDTEELWDALELYEASFADMMKKAKSGAEKITKTVARGAQKGVSKIGAAAKSAGNELGNIVTAKKLNRLWNKAGKPTDMGSVVNILNQAGVSDEQIGTVSKQAKVELSKPKGANEVDPKLQSLANQIIDLDLVDILKPALADG